MSEPENLWRPTFRLAPTRLRRWVQAAFLLAALAIVSLTIRVNVKGLAFSSTSELALLWGSTVGIAAGVIGFLYTLLQMFLDAGTATFHIGGAQVALDALGEGMGGETSAAERSKLERAGAIALAGELIKRLNDEVRAQGQRANANLGIGVMAALVGLSFLGWLAVTTAPGATAAGAARQAAAATAVEPRLIMMFYWGSFLAKVTLSITANVLAFFFLSTYRRNLSEVRYFQNELTNVQLQVAALLNAATHGFDATQKKILLSLAQTERNFVLRKGETTADIAVKTLDKEEAVAFAEIIADAVKKQFAPEKKDDE